MRIAEAVEIERGVEEVWRFACDPINDPAWCRKVKSVDRIAPDRWLVHHQPIPLLPAVIQRVLARRVRGDVRRQLRDLKRTLENA